MKLNLDIICDYLSKDFCVERFGPKERKTMLGRPLLYDGEGLPQQGQLYVARTGVLPKAPLLDGTVWICAGENLPADFADAGIAILLISNVRSVLSLYNAVQKIYDKFDAWEDTLRNELEKEESFDIRRMIELGSMMLENHIGISDQSLTVILSSEIIPLPDGQIRVTVSEVPFYPPIKTEEDVKEVLYKEGAMADPFLSSIRWKECRIYCYNLRLLGHYIGSVCLVERYRPFRQSDFPIADCFFSYFRLAFQKYLHTSSQTESIDITALHDLFHGLPLSKEEQEQLMLRPGESWICFKLQEIRSKNYMPRDFMSAIIRAMMPRTAYSAIHNNVITGLLRLPTGNLKTDESTIAAFQEIVDCMAYIGGFSNPFTDLSNINNYLLQADYAMKLHVQSGQTKPMCFFHDHVLQYMLSECTCHLPPEALYSNGLFALMEHDRKRDPSYMDTLDVYLRNEMNITRTAESLYLHRTSLIKRLHRIEQLLGTDLTDPDVRLYYRICLRLWKSNPANGTTG